VRNLRRFVIAAASFGLAGNVVAFFAYRAENPLKSVLNRHTLLDATEAVICVFLIAWEARALMRSTRA
jgi:hypothetical protein